MDGYLTATRSSRVNEGVTKRQASTVSTQERRGPATLCDGPHTSWSMIHGHDETAEKSEVLLHRTMPWTDRNSGSVEDCDPDTKPQPLPTRTRLNRRAGGGDSSTHRLFIRCSSLGRLFVRCSPPGKVPVMPGLFDGFLCLMHCFPRQLQWSRGLSRSATKDAMFKLFADHQIS